VEADPVSPAPLDPSLPDASVGAAVSVPPLDAIGTLGGAAPATADRLLRTRTARSIAAVVALVLALLVFLGLHRLIDRHDPKLATVPTSGVLARFR
jgi:hypothetical protein